MPCVLAVNLKTSTLITSLGTAMSCVLELNLHGYTGIGDPNGKVPLVFVPSAATVPHDIAAPLLLTPHSENNAPAIADLQSTLC
uniref:Secreted protein n=1 Tax=Angiostrongylus cantonensis TaxID=6313 RepID=A0A0K0CVR9_ANGCA